MDTAPKSASVSMSASASPATIAGRAAGRLTRRNTRSGEAPRLRPASKATSPPLANEARASRYT